MTADEIVARERGAVFHEGMVTAVRSIMYDFPRRSGMVWMPDLCAADMTGTIALFERIDPHVEFIITMAGEQENARYIKSGGVWRAFPGTAR